MNALTKRKHSRDDIVSKTIDRVLRQLFGSEARLFIYKYLETHHSLKQEEIAEKIEVFARGLEEYLSSGALVVETKILEEIYSNSGLNRKGELERIRNENDFPSQIRTLMRMQ